MRTKMLEGKKRFKDSSTFTEIDSKEIEDFEVLIKLMVSYEELGYKMTVEPIIESYDYEPDTVTGYQLKVYRKRD